MTAALGVSAEQYALGHLRRHRDAMTRPDMQNIADDSGLSVKEVAALWEQLLADRVPKTLDRPRVAPAPSPQGLNAATPARPVETPPADVGLPWRGLAADHPNAKVRRAAAKAVAAVEAVEQLLAAEAGKDELRRKEAKLAAQLAAVRAELRGGVSKVRREPEPAGDVERITCECGDLVRADRIAQHRNRSRKHQ